MKLEFSWQIFEKWSNTKFHEHPSSGNRVVPCGRTDRQKDMKTLMHAFRNFENSPKNFNYQQLNIKNPRNVHWLSIWCVSLHVTNTHEDNRDTCVNLRTKEFPLPLLFWSGPSNVVGIATSYGLDGPGIESRWRQDFPHLSRPALWPTQPSVQWVPGLPRGKEQPGHDSDPSPPSTAVVKKR
jgi:hypothetical protein